MVGDDEEDCVGVGTVFGQGIQKLVECNDLLFDSPVHRSTGELLGPTLLCCDLGNDQRVEALKERPVPAVVLGNRRDEHLKIGGRDRADPSFFVHRNGETFVQGVETLD